MQKGFLMCEHFQIGEAPLDVDLRSLKIYQSKIKQSQLCQSAQVEMTTTTENRDQDYHWSLPGKLT